MKKTSPGPFGVFPGAWDLGCIGKEGRGSGSVETSEAGEAGELGLYLNNDVDDNP